MYHDSSEQKHQLKDMCLLSGSTDGGIRGMSTTQRNEAQCLPGQGRFVHSFSSVCPHIQAT